MINQVACILLNYSNCKEVIMDYEELFKKYQELLIKSNRLMTENNKLKAQLGIIEPQPVVSDETLENNFISAIKKTSKSEEKIKLFLFLFRGRNDVYSKRWRNKEGKSGYSPVCLNEWKPGLCGKPRIKCMGCSHKSYGILDEKIIEQHLRGNMIVGIYPMFQNETCHFLAIDFDDEGWEEDIIALRCSCKDLNIPVAIERSRSGSGAHAWFFFVKQISAALARKFGTALLTYTMSKRHEITFKSYDRFFPNQDTMPNGGLGNLIALPLQMAARKDGNSVFIDEKFEPYNDQWNFMDNIKKLSEDTIEVLIVSLCRGNALGPLKVEDQEVHKPWETTRGVVQLDNDDFPRKTTIVRANMLYTINEQNC